jgi:hypothetical protein
MESGRLTARANRSGNQSKAESWFVPGDFPTSSQLLDLRA